LAKVDEAKISANALAKHIDLITTACLEENGQIFESEKNKNAIEAIIKARLATRIDDELYVQLNQTTRKFIQHATRGYRQRSSSGEVSGLDTRLRQNVESYKMAKRNASIRDIELFSSEIVVTVYEIIEVLRNLLLHFTQTIQNDFANIADIDLKLLQCKNCIAEASVLNRLLSTMNISEYSSLAGHEPFLERYLSRILMAAVDSCTRDLIDSTHRLRANLARLQKDFDDFQKSRLIDAFYSHYQRTPSFLPDIEGIESYPAILRLSSLKVSNRTPNINDYDHIDSIIAQAQNIRSSNQVGDEAIAQESVHIMDKMDAVIDVPTDGMGDNLKFFFDALPILSIEKPYSALTAYQALDVKYSASIWLISLMTFYGEMSEEEKRRVTPSFQEEVDPIFNGNTVISDVLFRYTHG